MNNITFVKVNQYECDEWGNDRYQGFFWKIEIEPKQQHKLIIDERATRLANSSFSEGGVLGQHILQYYNKYKNAHKNLIEKPKQ